MQIYRLPLDEPYCLHIETKFTHAYVRLAIVADSGKITFLTSARSVGHGQLAALAEGRGSGAQLTEILPLGIVNGDVKVGLSINRGSAHHLREILQQVMGDLQDGGKPIESKRRY